jgi:hypothetical protein
LSPTTLTDEEEKEVYVLLKRREGDLSRPLVGLMRRLEKSLYARLTVGEMERLGVDLSADR